MSSSRRRLVLAASVAVILTLTACASAERSGPGGTPAPAVDAPVSLSAVHSDPPSGRVSATGTVMDVAGTVQLCTGAIMESYPPQCHGIPLSGWSWEAASGGENSGDVTWGEYAVYGRYDGEVFTSTDTPIPLALYDVAAAEDPAHGIDGATPESELTRVHDEIVDELGADALTLWSERGYVWLQVVWDDGALQDAVDTLYGPGVVLVVSALRLAE